MHVNIADQSAKSSFGPRSKMLPTRATMEATGFSRPYLYALMKDGLFPRPVKWGDRFAVWPEDEVYAVINARVAGASDSALKQLVLDLVAARSERLPTL